ncbi:hypothetical protein NGC70_12710 [Staphylococcus xylosus]|nr:MULTISPECIES: hypothetical protein [Staphylococcus]MEB7823349.1 hypothetical protein [Staphylococcus xylosus]
MLIKEKDKIMLNTLALLSEIGGIITLLLLLIKALTYLCKDHYVKCEILHIENTNPHKVSSEFPIDYTFIIDKTINEYTIIGFPGSTLKNVKLLEFNLKKFNKSFKKEYIEIESMPQKSLTSEKYIAIQTQEIEGIDMYKIKGRINGNLVKINLNYNGKHGTRKKYNLLCERDIIGFLAHIIN